MPMKSAWEMFHPTINTTGAVSVRSLAKPVVTAFYF
jgi:hypothetical protein